MDVSCWVSTLTESPSCLPENARLINLFDRCFRSLDTAQSSKMIKVFVPENRDAQSVNNSLISSELLASGDNTMNRESPQAKFL